MSVSQAIDAGGSSRAGRGHAAKLGNFDESTLELITLYQMRARCYLKLGMEELATKDVQRVLALEGRGEGDEVEDDDKPDGGLSATTLLGAIGVLVVLLIALLVSRLLKQQQTTAPASNP